MNRPAFQFYPADWRKDPALSVCSLAARGMWIELMCIAHESDDYGVLSINGKPMSDLQIARLVGESPKLTAKLLAELEQAGVFSRNDAGAIFSRRMVKDEHLRNVRANAGKLGGNPNLVKQKDNHLLNQNGKQSLTPSSSSSSSIKPSVNDTLPSNPQTPSASSQTPGQKLNGYGPIAVELIELGIQVTSIHPTLQAWVDEGFTIERLRECVAIARQSKPAPEKIPANYLDRILREPPREAKAPKPKEAQWWASEKGIEAKGRELGMRPRGGESWNDFKARIYEKLKGNGNG